MIKPEDLAKSGSESANQKALFCWSALPDVRAKYPELKWLFAIPNGGSRDIREATNLKAQGVKSGIPDIMLPVKVGIYGALFIELKKPGTGKLSDEQKKWLDYLSSYYWVAVCYGWEEARDMILKYLGER